ncbi:MAG: hypothetical protein U9O89_00230 [Thermoproteota archaeon]|nr:hypothetical protein [Thermoproteota archaeon]
MKKKIVGATESAADHLERSIKALENDDEKKLEGLIWQAAAELEYTLFLFSVGYKNEIEKSSWKHHSSSKKLEVEPALIEARDLVKEAKTGVDADELSEAYKKTWKARGRLLTVQKILEKKRKSEGKK